VVDSDQLRANWLQIGKNGYHIVFGDLDEGAYSIAAPIRDHSGEVIAAVSIAGPISRLDKSRQQSHIENVIRAASEISMRLGYREGASSRLIA
jgi:IclR family KDG regulon transcriptional repressor